MMDNIKAVLFDFDDTLGNRNGYAYYMYDNFIRTYLSDIYDNKLLKEAMLQDMMTWDQRGDSDKSYPYHKIRDKYHVELPDIDFLQYFKDNINKYSYLCDDALNVINYLKTKYKVGLLTNGDKISQRAKVSHAIDLDIFDVVVISGEQGYHKPAKAIYDIAIAKLNVKPDEIVMVGDNFANDVYGAINAGMKAIWIWPDDGRPMNYYVARIYKLDELLELL